MPKFDEEKFFLCTTPISYVESMLSGDPWYTPDFSEPSRKNRSGTTPGKEATAMIQKQDIRVYYYAWKRATDPEMKAQLEGLMLEEVEARRALVDEKYCPKCLQWWETVLYFAPDNSRPDGWRGHCNTCRAREMKEYRARKGN